jgi:hypothetical protein
MKFFLPCLFFFCISLISCQKDFTIDEDPFNPSDSTIDADTCRITRSWFFGGGGVNDSADYIYVNNKLLRVEGSFADVIYTYDSNRVKTMKFYEKPAMRLYKTDSLIYNNNKLVRIYESDYDLFNQMDTIHSILHFNYTGNTLASELREDWYEGFPNDKDSTVYQFIYTNNNVSQMNINDVYGNILDSITYVYNNDLNYFGNVSAYFYLADPFFQLHVGFEPHLPYFISRNNVIGFNVYGIDYEVQYTTDSSHRPLTVNLDGFEYMAYRYNCP